MTTYAVSKRLAPNFLCVCMCFVVQETPRYLLLGARCHFFVLSRTLLITISTLVDIKAQDTRVEHYICTNNFVPFQKNSRRRLTPNALFCVLLCWQTRDVYIVTPRVKFSFCLDTRRSRYNTVLPVQTVCTNTFAPFQKNNRKLTPSTLFCVLLCQTRDVYIETPCVTPAHRRYDRMYRC